MVLNVTVLALGLVGADKAAFLNKFIGRRAFVQWNNVSVQCESSTEVTRCGIICPDVPRNGSERRSIMKTVARVLRKWNQGISAVVWVVDAAQEPFGKREQSMMNFLFDIYGNPAIADLYGVVARNEGELAVLEEFRGAVEKASVDTTGVPVGPHVPLFFFERGKEGRGMGAFDAWVRSKAVVKPPNLTALAESAVVATVERETGVVEGRVERNGVRYRVLVDREREKVVQSPDGALGYRPWKVTRRWEVEEL